MKRPLKALVLLGIIAIIAFIIFWYSRPADLDFESVKSSIPHSEISHFADIDGLRIHYQDKGDGPVLVLLHGSLSSVYSWKDVLDPLAERFRVIAVDFKGFGFSSKNAGDYTKRSQAQLLVRLLDQLKIERAVLCGNSMGGEIALNVARYDPQRVSGLVLVDSAGIDIGGVSVVPSFSLWPIIGPALTALTLVSDGVVRNGLRTSFYDQSKVTDERVAAYYRPLQTRDGQHAAYLSRRQSGMFPIEGEISKIRQPALIIWGADDRQIPLEAGIRLNAMLSGSRLVVLERCGHIPQEETPERFVREVLNFVPQA
jgi:pimeloyl-ACP methyl ester carboxylesterase